MSRVKRGRDLRTGEFVALKIMEKGGDSDRARRTFDRLQREIEAMRACDGHPHTVKLIHADFHAKYPKKDGSSKVRDSPQRCLEPVDVVGHGACGEGGISPPSYALPGPRAFAAQGVVRVAPEGVRALADPYTPPDCHRPPEEISPTRPCLDPVGRSPRW